VDSIPRSAPAPTSAARSRAVETVEPAHILPEPGDVIAGKYRIERIVGEGGMGIVYAAHHLVLEKRVALKLVLLDAAHGEELVERFVREAQAAARLQSEHLARVTDAGALENGLPFLIMEYLEGRDLGQVLEAEGRLTTEDAADYVLQVLAALAQAHAAGIVHRDLKPANLFLAARPDGTKIVKVLDFGISKQQPATPHWKELTGKAVLGTPAYMSPEQLRSSRNVDARADIWSIGVVLYELLTGERPFNGEGPGELFAAILETAPFPLRGHRPELSQAWDDLVTRCLLRSPDARFQDVAELAAALAPLGSGRYEYLVASIESTCAASVRAMPRANAALLEAAVHAAIASLPPPADAIATRQLDIPIVTGKTKLTFSDVARASLAPQPAARRSPGSRVSAFALAAVVLVGVGTLASRGSFQGSAHAAASQPPPLPPTVMRVEPPRAPPTALPLPVVDKLVPAPPPVETSSLKAPATPVSLRKPTSPGKPRTTDARPKFLKSWR